MEAIVTSVNHTLTGIDAIRSRSNFLSVFISNEIEENDSFGTEYVVMDESSFSFKTSDEGALTTCKKSNIFLWNRQGTVRLFDSRLQLSKRTFCKILSNCRSERDVEAGLNWPKSRHHFRLGRSDSHLEQKEMSATTSAQGRFSLNIRNLSWTFGCKFVMIPGQPQPLLYFNDFHFMIPTNSGALFSKVPKLFGQISGDIILFVSSK